MKKKKIKDVKLPIIPVILSSFMLVYGTYAWFTYFSDVNSTMTGHVIGWNIDFDGKTNIENEYEIVINDIFPGMEEYINEYKITNSGEAAAIISSDIKKITIFEDEYVVGEEYDGEILTNNNIFEILNKKYSFIMNVDISQNIIKTNESSVFKYTLTWPFESYVNILDTDTFDSEKNYYVLNNEVYEEVKLTENEFNERKSELYILNDESDTTWGIKAYEFKNENPDSPCIRIEMMINASQYIE